MMRKYVRAVQIVGARVASILATCRTSFDHCRRGTTMQWIGNAIEAPISGSIDAGLERATAGDAAMTFGRDLLQVLQAIQDGDFSVRMSGDHDGLSAKIAEAVNVIAAANQRIAQQLDRFGEQLGRQIALQQATAELERRITESMAELEQSKRRLQDSEDRRKLALAAGKMGSWDWDLVDGHCHWDEGQKQMFGADPVSFEAALPNIRALVDRGDWKMLCRQLKRARRTGGAWQLEFRVRRPDGSVRWCLGTAVAVRDAAGRISRIRGITMDITERKEAEDRQSLLAREVDHRTKNALACVHAIVSLTRAADIDQFSAAVEGRVQALARAHSLLSESRWRGAKIADLVQGELAPFRAPNPERIQISGRGLSLHPSAVQALALAVHELAANAARHGALSAPLGGVHISWEQQGDELALRWTERGGPAPQAQMREGFGMRIIKASVEIQLCGTVAFDWQPDGMQCAIRVPCHPKTELFGNFLYSSIQTSGNWPDVGLHRRMAALS
jgi:two-component sensor histidine kinase/PAS domain-containing protein